MNSAHILSILFVLSFLFTSSIYSQENDRIIDVEIRGLLTIRENTIKDKLKTRKNKLFSSKTLNEDILRLHREGYFSRIETKVIDTDHGTKIIFLVTENLLIQEVKISGNSEIDAADLRKDLRLIKDKVRYLSDYILSLDEIKLKEYYHEQGFLFVQVKAHKIPLGDRLVDVHFKIDEGPQVYVKEINFFGNKNYKKDELTKFIQTAESGYFESSYYNKNKFAEDLLTIRNFYRSEGYLDAKIDTRDFFYSNDRQSIVLNVQVVEGPRYKIGEIKMVGNKLFTEKELRDRITVKEKGPLKQNDILSDKQRIQSLYANNGYLNVKIEINDTLPDLTSYVKNITFKIQEGDKVYIRLLEIDGNTLTQDKVVRREYANDPSEQFNLQDITRTQQRLSRLQYFDTIKMDFEKTEDDEWQDIITKVEEGRTGNLRFAAGITSDAGAVGQISLTKRNFDITKWPSGFGDLFSGDAFTGAGQTFNIDFQGGQEIFRFAISFEDPYFLDYNLIFGLSLFRRERIRESFDEQRTGFQISLGRNLSSDMAIRFSYRFEIVDIQDVDGDAPQDVVDVEGENYISGLSVQYTINTTDSFILPTRGYKFQATYELVGTYLGGDHDFSQIELGFAWFYTLYTNKDGHHHIFSFFTNLGVAFPHDDTDNVPIFERFFAGGASNAFAIRGFQFRTVGPIDVGSDDPLGGEFAVAASIEYSFPLYGDTLRGVLFSDLGNVVPEVGDNIYDTYRMSVGLGVRLKIPVFGPRPFAFDFAFPVQEEDGDDIQVFSFSFGKPF